MLTNTKEMLLDAKKNHYGVAQPNMWDLNSLRAIINSCNKTKSPAIIGIAEAHFKYITPEEAGALIDYYKEKIKTDFSLHLDHGQSFEAIIRAIRSGFTSVMMDCSSLPFDENVKRTQEVVKIAHACNVTVEAELGHVGMGEDYAKIDTELFDLFTNPAEAKKFVELTNVDSLAIAVGTAHGEYKGTPKLDFNRITEISNTIHVPLVLHGGSGTGDAALAKCISLGISKVNICTDLMNAASKSVSAEISHKNYGDVSLVEQEAVEKCLIHYMNLFGSSNRY